MSEKLPESEKPHQHQPGEGIRSMRSTGLFRAVNFELYAKPVSILQHIICLQSMQTNSKIFNHLQNLVIMVIGGVCFGTALGYITYMRSKYESQGYYAAVQPDGTEVYTKKRSKWE